MKPNVVDLNAAEYVAHVFGGVGKLAEVLGLQPSTVSHWLHGQGRARHGRGVVPARYQRELLQKAKILRVDLNPSHLIYGGEVEGIVTARPAN